MGWFAKRGFTDGRSMATSLTVRDIVLRRLAIGCSSDRRAMASCLTARQIMARRLATGRSMAAGLATG
jgi:hypothetical protein